MAQKQKKPSFDIKSMLNTASMENQTQKRKKINYTQLISHEKNHYSLEGLEDLADSIENVGLLHDVLVKDSGEVNEEGEKLYTVISGHRRVLAITSLVEERELKKFKDVPCVILEKDEDETVTELKLHYANITSRELTEYDKMVAASEIKRLVEEAKGKGIKIKGRMRDIVSDAVGLGPTQTQKYLTVDEYSSDEVKEKIKSGDLTIENAYEIIQENKKEIEQKPADEEKTGETPEPEITKQEKKISIEHVEKASKETVKEKMYKSLIKIEKSFIKNAGEFESFDEIEDLFEKLKKHFK